MNTLDDLESVFRDLAGCAPDLEDVRHTLAADLTTPPRQLRRFLLPAAAAAAIAAIAVVAIVLTSGDGENRPVHPGSGPPQPATSTQPAPTSAPTSPIVRSQPFELTWHFALRPVPGYVIVRESISANDQSARVTVKGANKDIGGIDVYGPGVVPPELATLSKGMHITVNGSPGYFAVTGQRSALIWEYGNGAWAEVSGDWGYSPSGVDAKAARAAETRIASGVDTATRDPLRIDFTLGYLPSGLRLRNTIFWADPLGQGPLCELDFVDDVAGQQSGDGSNLPAVTITRTGIQRDTGQPGNTAFTPNMTVGARPAQYSKGYLAVRYPNNTELSIAVDANHYARYPKAVLVKIAEQAAPVGAPSEPNTWATGDKAVPR